MIIIILMLFISFFIFRFFLRIWVYGDESNFYVVGKHNASLAGLIVALIISIASYALNVSIYPSVFLFLFSVIFLFLNLTPALKINGSEATYISRRGRITFTKSDTEFESRNEALFVCLKGQLLPIYRDSINFDKLVDWL